MYLTIFFFFLRFTLGTKSICDDFDKFKRDLKWKKTLEYEVIQDNPF